jgi:hypothetical protein
MKGGKTMTKVRFPFEGPSCRYNNQVCVGGYRPTLQDMFRTHRPHGLAYFTVYWYGSFRDEEGGIYMYMRNLGAEALPVVYLYYKAPGADPIVHPEAWNFFRGMCVNRMRGDEIRIRSWRNIPGPGYSLIINPDGFRQVEDDRMELTGKRVGLGMNAFTPHNDESYYYSSVIYEAEGTLLGRKVKGAMGYDMVCGPSGEMVQTMRYYNEVEATWVSGINVYDDGVKEMYHAVAGKGDWGWIFLTEGDEITALSRSVRAYITEESEISGGKGKYPSRILFETDCGNWEWISEPNCCFDKLQYSGEALCWAEGQTLRVGEKRKSLVSLGWIDLFPDRLERK